MTDAPLYHEEIVHILAFIGTRETMYAWHEALQHNKRLRAAWYAYRANPERITARAKLVALFRARFPNELPSE